MSQFPPYVAGSHTSKEAAQRISPRRASIAEQIHVLIREAAPFDGYTCMEIEGKLGLKHQTASPRFNELAAAGCIRANGDVRDGAKVYVLAPGATYEQYREWLRANNKKDRKVKIVHPVPTTSTEPPTGMERMVIARAHIYADAVRSGKPASTETEALLEAARWIKRGY